jgi:uncharacterized protein
MSQATHTSGRFIWHDLMTTDPKSAIAFYAELFAWKTTEVEMGSMGKYTMIKAGDRDIGGIVPLDKSHGAPSHWIGYCTVSDVDAAVKRGKELGGKVHVPPADIPEVGRFAVIADPQGGVISPFKATVEKPDTDEVPPVGAFCWNELLTSDPAAALAFYQGVFGWTHAAMDMGPMGTYHLLKRGQKESAGLMKQMMEGAPTAWLAYVSVADVDASTKRAASLKAKVFSEPQDIPNIGRFSVIQDPTGAVVALFKGTKKM